MTWQPGITPQGGQQEGLLSHYVGEVTAVGVWDGSDWIANRPGQPSTDGAMVWDGQGFIDNVVCTPSTSGQHFWDGQSFQPYTYGVVCGGYRYQGRPDGSGTWVETSESEREELIFTEGDEAILPEANPYPEG